MSQPEFERVSSRRVGQFVHEALASEVVGGGSQGAIGSVAQRRVGRDVTAAALSGPIRRLNAGPPGVNVDEMPGGERAFGVQGGFYFDDGRRAEIGTGKFLFAGPAQGDWVTGGPG